MPELPEVETITRALAPLLTGRVIDSVHVARTDVIHGVRRSFSRRLAGRRIESVRRRAKRILCELSPPSHLTFHLGMSGRLVLTSQDEPVEPHTHLRLRFGGVAQELRFRDPRRFGGVWFEVPGERTGFVGRRLGPLGVEPLEVSQSAFRRLLAPRRRQIKALLLDQTVIAGLGNIYCDESLHRAGIHPRLCASELTNKDATRLLRSVQAVLRSAIRHQGTTLMDYRTAEGDAGSFRRRLRVYHRAGRPCSTCGTLIQRIIVAGRSTFFCPLCQPEELTPYAGAWRATVRRRDARRGASGARNGRVSLRSTGR